MNRVRTLYRSTLIAAAHEQGWRGCGERAWQPVPPPRWYRHGHGHGGWRYAPQAPDCEVPLAGPANHALPRACTDGVVLELPAP